MAYFAKLDENNVVTSIVKVANEVLENAPALENEEMGQNFLKTLYNEPNAIWKQCSYNKTFRKSFATLGGTYDPTRDAFISKKPYNSWVLNETTCLWEPPVSLPADAFENDGTVVYEWDEPNTNWKVKAVALE